MREKQKKYSWRAHLHEIIFEADTPAGRLFDVVLIIFILLSIVVVSLDSVRSLRMYAPWFRFFEWFFTLVFTVEYILRILTTGKPLAYVRSFFGVIDLLAILPTYISPFPGNTLFTGHSKFACFTRFPCAEAGAIS